MRTIIRDVRIVDGRRSEPFPGAVLVDGDRIAAVLYVGAVEPSADLVIKGQGRTSMRGMSAMKASAVERLALEEKLVPELKRRGVRVLVGGDYGFPFNPNGRNARDVEHFVNYYGYTSSEALVAATKLGGELMDLPLAQVREGYLADLLLVDGDPAQNVAVLQDKARLAMIMQGGVLRKAPAELAA